MKRREFLTLIGGAVAFRPLAGHAQPAESARRIGMLIGTFAKADREGQDRIAAFLDTFQKLGWSDGRNFRMDYHWGAGNSEEIAVTAKELLRATPDVIVVARQKRSRRHSEFRSRLSMYRRPKVATASRPGSTTRSQLSPISRTAA
jgi:hypothetical protein